MAENIEPSWGHTDRHYAARLGELPRRSRADEHIANRWAGALGQASPGTRDSVERTFKQWNTVLRDHLRTETALRLSVGDGYQSVPVKIDEGMPQSFIEVIRNFDGLEWLLLNRPAVEAVASGTEYMEPYVGKFRESWGDAAGPASAADVRNVRDTAKAWLNKLDEAKALEQIVGINEDVLGAYFFRIPEIRLYWVVIGITSRALGVSVEALTVVVLAHELAHAYTHRGHDIDKEKWDTEEFASSDLEIVEGLAQFYTQVTCERLKERMPDALPAYEKLLKLQPAPYQAHLEWIADHERGSEIVRVSMIECRSKGITGASHFAAAVARHRQGVRGRAK